MKRFVLSCIQCPPARVPALDAMIQGARDITFATFMKHVDVKEMAELFPGYAWERGERGLRMSKDFAVSFHKSKFEGRECVYARWSAIEYVFV